MASFASLFLILALAALPILNRSKGLPLDLATVEKDGPVGCGDHLTVVAILHDDGSLFLNSEPQKSASGLRVRLGEIFRTRAERVLFLQAEPHVAFGDVAMVLDAVRPAVDVVSLITSDTQRKPNFSFCVTISNTARDKR